MFLVLNKKSSYSLTAFTLIELLVVIAIIALLSTLSVVALNNARAKARDARRLSDVKQISTALELYYNSHGIYPNSPNPVGTPITNLCLSELGITSTCGTEVYMKNIPADPAKDKHYLYAPLINNSSFNLIYDEETIADCPTDWVRVPGNTLYNTHSFCVMKYEAKIKGNNIGAQVYNSSYEPESRSSGTPWVNITQTNAKLECESIGAHLITEDEWLSIVRNLELQASNWTGGVIGSGQIPRGNSSGSAALDGTNELTGVNKRTHTLSNGEVIWDLAGNVYDRTDATILGKDQPTGSSTPVGFGWFEYSGLLNYGSLAPERLLPMNNYNYIQGYGRIYSSGVSTNTTNYAFLRGGYWSSGANAGVLTLGLRYGPGSSNTYFGFRCVR